MKTRAVSVRATAIALTSCRLGVNLIFIPLVNLTPMVPLTAKTTFDSLTPSSPASRFSNRSDAYLARLSNARTCVGVPMKRLFHLR